MTPEEKESIIQEITERMLLRIPEIVGNLIQNYAAKITINKEFYAKYPEFGKHRDIVAATIEEMDSKSGFKKFEQVVEESVPIIRNRIEKLNGIDTKTVKTPNLDFSQGEL